MTTFVHLVHLLLKSCVISCESCEFTQKYPQIYNIRRIKVLLMAVERANIKT